MKFAPGNEAPTVKLLLVRENQLKIGRRLASVPFCTPVAICSIPYDSIPEPGMIFFEAPISPPRIKSQPRTRELSHKPYLPKEYGEYSTG
jgi:hypothetical protein